MFYRCFKDVSGFIRKVCTKDGETFFQCPGSQHHYQILNEDNDYQELSRVCPEDTYHYTACYLPSFTPMIFNNTVVAVCGDYVCNLNYFGWPVYSGEYYTSRTWCNNKVDCLNGDVDEMYCAEEDTFECRDYTGEVTNSIITSRVCDRKCDCGTCNDEWQCGGYNYHYWYTCSNTREIIPSYLICVSYFKNCYDERNCRNITTCILELFPIYTYKITNYSRCTPWVMCTNKLDHTKCTDTTLAPLQCPVGDYVSTVSQYIVCKKEVYASEDDRHSNTSAVCDDGIVYAVCHTSTWLLHTQTPTL